MYLYATVLIMVMNSGIRALVSLLHNCMLLMGISSAGAAETPGKAVLP